MFVVSTSSYSYRGVQQHKPSHIVGEETTDPETTSSGTVSCRYMDIASVGHKYNTYPLHRIKLNMCIARIHWRRRAGPTRWDHSITTRLERLSSLPLVDAHVHRSCTRGSHHVDVKESKWSNSTMKVQLFTQQTGASILLSGSWFGYMGRKVQKSDHYPTQDIHKLSVCRVLEA